MSSSSILFVLLAFFAHKLCASEADLQKLCEGQRYGTLVPNPKDCNSFYVCQFVVQLTHCDTGLHFDRRNKVCNWPQFAGCDWVEAESGSSVELPVEKPEKPIPDGDKSLETDFEPQKPFPGEETIPSDGGNDSDDKQNPNPGVETIPTGDDNLSQPSSAEKTSEEAGNISGEEHIKESEESKSVTEDDVITEKPYTPSSSSEEPKTPSHSSQEEIITGKGVTEDDVITDKPYSPRPSSGEDQDHKLPSTDGDVIIDEPLKPSHSSEEDIITFSKEDPAPWKPDPTPDENAVESGELIPNLPKPNHPPTSEEIDPKPSEGSQEKLPPIEDHNPGDLEPPYVDGNVDKPDPGFFLNHSSQHWNLIASMVSVESSKDNGFINRPIAGAHSTETGYPVDVMTGYDPSNVQCLHNGLYFLPHPGSCQKYFICAYRHLHLHSCGSGVIWNHKREQCDLKGYAKCYSRDGDEEVSTEVITPPVIIEESTEKSTQETTTVAQTPTTRKPPTTISHRLPICPMNRQVYLPNLDDCRRYFICIMGKPVLTSCPSGMHWDAIGEFCGKPTVVRCAHR